MAFALSRPTTSSVFADTSSVAGLCVSPLHLPRCSCRASQRRSTSAAVGAVAATESDERGKGGGDAWPSAEVRMTASRKGQRPSRRVSSRTADVPAATASASASASPAFDRRKTNSNVSGRKGAASKPKRLWGVNAKQNKARRTRGKAFVIVCDAESVTHPELLECIDLVEELGTRDFGMIYADWRSMPVSKASLSVRDQPAHE